MGSVAAETDRPEATAQVRRPLLAIAAVGIVVVAVDQITKWWAVSALSDPPKIIDLVWTLRLRLIYNYGTAFSLTSDSGPIVSVVAIVVIAALVWSGRHQRSRPVIVGYGLIVGGTIGNLVDRVLREGDGFARGGVVDFVDLQWFPVFNAADAALTVGIALLVVLSFFGDHFDEPEPATDDADE